MDINLNLRRESVTVVPETPPSQLDKLVKKSNRILASISTHNFLNLFPDTINIEESRVTVITRNFFLSSQIHSVDIKDISNVFINTAPFFVIKLTWENEPHNKNF